MSRSPVHPTSSGDCHTCSLGGHLGLEAVQAVDGRLGIGIDQVLDEIVLAVQVVDETVLAVQVVDEIFLAVQVLVLELIYAVDLVMGCPAHDSPCASLGVSPLVLDSVSAWLPVNRDLFHRP